MASPLLPVGLGEGGFLDIEATTKSGSEIFRNSSELVKAERDSRQAWQELHPGDQWVLLVAIRETLLRLLQAPDWIPGSVDLERLPTGNHRLDIRLSVHLECLDDYMRSSRQWSKEDQADRLLELARRLGLTDGERTGAAEAPR